MDIICQSPCLIREDHRILFVSEVEGSKLKPFLTKENILIPKKAELKYFSGFVLNTINNFKVVNSGFEIIEFQPDKKACLTIEFGLKGNPVLILSFSYEGTKIYSNEILNSFTFFEKKAENYIFKKSHRDFNWEKQCRETLGGLGFFSDDDINFSPASPTIKRKDELYSFLEIINSSYSDITRSGFILESKLDARYNLKEIAIEISSQIINDWFDLRATVKIGEWEIPFSQFRKNILEGMREYVLPDGSIAILPETWFTKYKNIFEFGKSTDE